MEIEWHSFEQWMGQEWDQGRNQKVSGNKWKSTHNSPKVMGHSEGSPEWEVHSNTGLPKKGRNNWKKQPNPIPTWTGEITTKTAQSKRRKEITKIRAQLVT